MTKVKRIQAVITDDEMLDLAKEAFIQKRTISNLIRKYVVDGVKRDKDLKEKK